MLNEPAMKAVCVYRIQSYAVLTLIGIGYGFYSGWNQISVTLSIIFGALLVSECLAYNLALIVQSSLKAIRRMTPTELEAYLETLSSETRQRFVSQLFAEPTANDQYVRDLTPEQRARYDALLEKLEHEQRRGRT